MDLFDEINALRKKQDKLSDEYEKTDKELTREIEKRLKQLQEDKKSLAYEKCKHLIGKYIVIEEEDMTNSDLYKARYEYGIITNVSYDSLCNKIEVSYRGYSILLRYDSTSIIATSKHEGCSFYRFEDVVAVDDIIICKKDTKFPHTTYINSTDEKIQEVKTKVTEYMQSKIDKAFEL